MYSTFHSSRIYSDPIHGYLFVAQLLSGEINYGARLATPIGDNKNDFYLGDYEWEKKPYVLDLGPLYRRAFETPEVKQWIADVVEPWAREQKLKYLETAIKHAEARLDDMYKESLALQTHKTGE